MIDLLDRIRDAGGAVAVVGGDLRLRVPRGLLSEAERLLLAEHKPEIVRLLAVEPVVETPVVEPDLDEEAVDPPAPCQQCGSLMAWWDVLGGVHCMDCEPPVRSERLREQAERIRTNCRYRTVNKRA
jgi:hypothetical protein